MSSMKRPPYVHTDPRIVHAPRTCTECDNYGGIFQELRVAWGINFTGEDDPTKLPCPTEWSPTKAAHEAAAISAAVSKKRFETKPYCKHCQYLHEAHYRDGACPHSKAGTYFDPLSLEEKHALIRDATIRMAADILGIKKR